MTDSVEELRSRAERAEADRDRYALALARAEVDVTDQERKWDERDALRSRIEALEGALQTLVLICDNEIPSPHWVNGTCYGNDCDECSSAARTRACVESARALLSAPAEADEKLADEYFAGADKRSRKAAPKAEGKEDK